MQEPVPYTRFVTVPWSYVIVVCIHYHDGVIESTAFYKKFF